MLSLLASWFATKGAGLILGFFAGVINDQVKAWRDDANAKALGATTVTAKINQEAADADRRVTKATIDAPDIGGVLDDLERGKL